MATWLELPKVLWEHIFELLDLLDRLRFRAACKLFRSVAVGEKPYRLSRALLMLPGEENSETRDFFSLSDSNIYGIHLPEFHGRWCCGSSFGWLFTVDLSSGDIALLNPITRAQISLPPLSTFTDPPELSDEDLERNIQYVERAILSTSPSTNKNFVVMAIFTSKWALSFCRPGDEKWTTLTRQGDHCEDVIYHKGKFYSITNWGDLIAWDCCDVDAPVKTIISRPSYDTGVRRYLVESPSGELFKVCRDMEWDDSDDDEDSHFHTTHFAVFKLDEEMKWWIRVERLGDKALLLGYNRAIFLSSLECPEFKANCIYFTDDYFEGYHENPNGSYDIGVFSLNDGIIEKFYQNPPFWAAPCIWITPTAC